MALSANTVWEVRSSGSSTNGGGFVRGASGTDWTQQNTAQYSVTDAVTNGTTTITSASASFGTDVVGNILYIQGGTGAIAAGRYQITARNSATNITVDRATGLNAGTGATLKIGGAIESITTLQTAMINSNIAYFNGSFVLTGSAITLNGTGGRQFVGYGTTRGDSGQAEFNASGMTASQNTFSIGDHNTVRNFKVTSSKAIAFTTANQAACINCTAINATTVGFQSIQSCIGCYASGCQTGFNSCSIHVACVAQSTTTGQGFTGGNAVRIFINCIAISCGSSGTVHGFNLMERSHAINCVSYGSRNNGFNMANMVYCVNCIAVNNGGYGFNTVGDVGRPGVQECAGFNNTSGNYNGTLFMDTDVIALTNSPFVDVASGNFKLNTISGAGALCRGTGYPGILPHDTDSVGYADIGVLQHQDNTVNIINRRRRVR